MVAATLAALCLAGAVAEPEPEPVADAEPEPSFAYGYASRPVSIGYSGYRGYSPYGGHRHWKRSADPEPEPEPGYRGRFSHGGGFRSFSHGGFRGHSHGFGGFRGGRGYYG